MMTEIFYNIPLNKWKYILETFIMDYVHRKFDLKPISRKEEYVLSPDFVQKYKLKESTSSR
jgi:hypothetical protein